MNVIEVLKEQIVKEKISGNTEVFVALEKALLALEKQEKLRSIAEQQIVSLENYCNEKESVVNKLRNDIYSLEGEERRLAIKKRVQLWEDFKEHKGKQKAWKHILGELNGK